MEAKSEEAATTSGQPNQPQPNQQNGEDESRGSKLKYKTIEIYSDDAKDDYRAVVYFESGETASFSNLKQGIARIEGMIDDESIYKFRVDLIGLLKNGGFDAELLVPGAISDPEEKNQTNKFGYSGIELHEDNNGQSGIVHLLYKGSTYLTGVRDFDEFNRVCRDLDPESAARFMDEVVKLQKEGKLQRLLPNAAEKNSEQETEIEELQDKLQDLLLEERQLYADGLSYFAVADLVVNHMTNGLNDPRLDPYFITMHNRSMVIRIIVDDTAHKQQVLELVVDPRNFINQDVSHETMVLKKEVESTLRELEEAYKSSK